MKKILYLWQAKFPWEIRVEKVCRVLQSKGCHITILARWKPGQENQEEQDGMRIRRLGKGLPSFCSVPVSYNPWWHSFIRKTVKDWHPDMVIAREILLAESAAHICRRHGIPMIIDMAEHYPATLRSFKKYNQNPILRTLIHRVRLRDLVERRSVRLADGIITVCEEQSNRLHRQLGYPLDKMAVVHNTPDINNFANVKTGAASPPKTFAYHGTMTAQRGLDILVAGFIAAAKKNADIQLLLAGDGESYADLVGQAKASEVSDRIHFTGRYKFEDLADLYGQTDVGAIPQPPDESCNHTVPNKLYDYLACGKPVIVSPAAPLKRIVEETETGIALDSCTPEEMAKAIERISHMDLRKMAENGIRVAKQKMNWSYDSEVLWRFVREYF